MKATDIINSNVALRWVLNGGRVGYAPAMDEYESLHVGIGSSGQDVYTFRNVRNGRYLYADLGGNCYTYDRHREVYTPVSRSAAVAVAGAR